MKYTWTYRGGEASGTVEAKDEGEAIDKVLRGECTVDFDFSQMHTDMVEVSPLEEESEE